MDGDTRPVVVIGAGPYGLSTVAHLRAANVPVSMLGSTMASWRDGMPAGMLLKSVPSASSISAPESGATIGRYLNDVTGSSPSEGDRVELTDFVDYGSWFARRFTQAVHRDECVTRVDRHNLGFSLELGSGDQVAASAVVVAAGHRPHAWMPAELERAARESSRVTHSSCHSDLSRFSGCRVAVVGAGQSALETAVLLSEAGAQTTVVARRSDVLWDLPPRRVTRTSELIWPPTGVGPGWPKRILERHAGAVRHLPWSARRYLLANVLGPSGSYWLRDRFENHVELRLGASVTAVRTCDAEVRIDLSSPEGVSTLEVDHLVAATGYRFDVDRLCFIDPGIRRSLTRVGGFPALSGSLESSVPGLYFTGLAAAGTFGPLLRFVCGTRFAGPRAAAAIASAHAI